MNTDEIRSQEEGLGEEILLMQEVQSLFPHLPEHLDQRTREGKLAVVCVADERAQARLAILPYDLYVYLLEEIQASREREAQFRLREEQEKLRSTLAAIEGKEQHQIGTEREEEMLMSEVEDYLAITHDWMCHLLAEGTLVPPFLRSRIEAYKAERDRDLEERLAEITRLGQEMGGYDIAE